MTNIIIRTVHLPDSTIGQLEIEGTPFRCFTLELPWKENKSNISSIPEGVYKYEKRESPSLGQVIHLLDVPGRTWIYIHSGNDTSQIQGCILVGTSIKDINSDGIPDVADSKHAFEDIMSKASDKGSVTITRNYKCCSR
jgi:hypothetical protein